MELLKPLRLPFSSDDVLNDAKVLYREVTSDASFNHPYTPEAPILDNVDSRRNYFKMCWAYLDNTIYYGKDKGGYREIVNDFLGSAQIGNLAALFNPVERAVRAYEYVFDGKFGEEIKIDENVEEGKTNPQLIKFIGNIWKWSNVNSWKNELLIRTAALGNCGLQIQYRDNGDGKKIFLIPDHPSKIREIEKDSRDNITQIVLEYEQMEGDFYGEGDDRRSLHRYIKYMSRDKFWMTRDGQWWNYTLKNGQGDWVDSKDKAEVKNILGIVPYVLITQTKIGSAFGVPCFYGKERQIDHLNTLAAHINQQIRRHITATWLIEANGPPPKKLNWGDRTIWYVQKETGSTSTVTVKDLVSNLNLAQAILQQTKLQEELANSIPEMKATDGQFLSHQSGGTVAQLRLPAEQRILTARNNIEEGFIKAQQIATSLGILYSMVDLGTGMGSRAKADEAYAQGLEDHRFVKRTALPLTTDDKLLVAKTNQANAAAENPEVITGVKGGDNTAVPSPTISGTSGD